MKRKVIVAIGIVCLIFFLGGAYIIFTTESATSKLDYLIMLHQVEILREQLLIHIKKTESDLSLRDTPHASGIDTLVANVRYLEKTLDKCFECHRSEEVLKWIKRSTNEDVLKKLNAINDKFEEYKGSLSRFLTMRANRERTLIEYDMALSSAQQLVKEVSDIIHVTSAKLAEKTQSSYKDISGLKSLLYLLVTMAPFLAAVLGLFFIRKITKPVKILSEATRRLKRGDLDHRVEGLKDEFGEVAASFNEMSLSLKQNMHKIRESERRYRTLFESAGDAIFILEAEGEDAGKIVEANRAAAEMHGYAADELLGLNIVKDLDMPDAAKDALARFQRILDGEWIHTEISHRKRDGTVFPVEVSAGLLQFMDHRYILAFDRDISDRKKMENEILQSKQYWEDTFDTIPDGITIHDKDFNIVRANKAAEKMLGLPSLECTKVKCYEYYHGKESPPEECLSCECLRTGKPASFETFEPHLGRYLELRAMPRFDNNNQMMGLIHVIRDISERKRVEEALQRTEQMKMVGELATALAHEIKNPLAGIKASVEFVARDVDLSEEDRGIIKLALDEFKRIETLIKSLLDFAKPPKPKLAVVGINDILDRAVTFALRRPSSSSDKSPPVRVSKAFDKDLPDTLADPMQMQQVFLNLLINAIEAMPDGGTLSLRTRCNTKRDAIQITISDTGNGIERGIIENIFQPFFTTKRKGTGLGLAITRRLVEQHGGHINVKSTPGKGTVFSISLRVNKVDREQMG